MDKKLKEYLLGVQKRQADMPGKDMSIGIDASVDPEFQYVHVFLYKESKLIYDRSLMKGTFGYNPLLSTDRLLEELDRHIA